MIELEGLSKSFTRRERLFRFRRAGRPSRDGAAPDPARDDGVVHAVRDLTLSVEPGEFVGFLGPNGAGKSTTIKMMTGILHPTRGSVRVDGLSPQRQRVRLARRIGVVFGQRTQLWWDLPLKESYLILRAMYRVPWPDYRRRLAALDDLLGLAPFLDTPVRQLSLGQRMRGELAGALLHRPSVLFLDEPTIGLDVVAKEAVRRFLREENRNGTTVILTTHDMADVEELCGRIVVINHGRAVFDGSPAAIHEQVGLPSAMLVTFREMPDLRRLAALGLAVEAAGDGGASVFVQFNRAERPAPAVLEALREHGEIVDFTLREPRLETVIQKFYR